MEGAVGGGVEGEEVERAKEERVLQRGNPDSDAAVVLHWKGDVCGLWGGG